MSQPSISWNRVLPKPPPLYHLDNHSERRSNPLFQHHLVSIGEPTDTPDIVRDRRKTIHGVPNQERPRYSPPVSPFFRAYPIHVSDDLPSGPLTRKRAASLMAEESSEREPSPASTSNSNPEPTNQFCLCQPDPKIPRPRNAFILYRQHHQATVVQQNPGLANPEISKIIGEQWRALPAKIKNEWKALAEEEKARHQQQYPDYRYQPRRYGRNAASVSGNNIAPSANGPTGHCSRCGGKVMNPPITPNAPPSPDSPTSTMSTVAAGTAVPGRAFSRNGAPLKRPFTYGQLSPPPPQLRHDPYVVSQTHSPINAQDRHRDYGQAVVSPVAKRRRFNGDNVYIPPHPEPGPNTPYPYTGRRPSLPPPEAIYPRSSIPMGPPSTARAVPLTANRPSTSHDPSLTLPPLQTPGVSGHSGRQQPAKAGGSGSDGVDKAIGQMHVLNKIKLLSRVAPPLPSPGLPSSSQEDVVRGAVLAVDGHDTGDVDHLATYLTEFLSKDGAFLVRRFNGPGLLHRQPEGAVAKPHDTTIQYLKAISEWHTVSSELESFICPPSSPSSSPTPDAKPNSSTTNQSSSNKEPGKERETGSISPKTVFPNASQPNTILQPPPPTSSSTLHQPFRRPIAILPHYQLSAVESAAQAIPIVDAYAPVEHWQWAAALWRGCVGPNITVVVRDCDEAEILQWGGGMPVEVRLGAGGSGGGSVVTTVPGNASRPGGGGSSNRAGMVGATGEARAVVVRKLKGDKLTEGGMAGEKALRRVAFEIVEFLRR